METKANIQSLYKVHEGLTQQPTLADLDQQDILKSAALGALDEYGLMLKRNRS